MEPVPHLVRPRKRSYGSWQLTKFIGAVLTAMMSFTPLAGADTSPYMQAACHKPVNLDLYAKENFEEFPCDLKKLKASTKIWVIA
jgi:hypothetical protein